MPSVSKAQADFMRIAAHNAKFAAKVGVPQSVAREFNQADSVKKVAKSMRKKHGAY